MFTLSSKYIFVYYFPSPFSSAFLFYFFLTYQLTFWIIKRTSHSETFKSYFSPLLLNYTNFLLSSYLFLLSFASSFSSFSSCTCHKITVHSFLRVSIVVSVLKICEYLSVLLRLSFISCLLYYSLYYSLLI